MKILLIDVSNKTFLDPQTQGLQQGIGAGLTDIEKNSGMIFMMLDIFDPQIKVLDLIIIFDEIDICFVGIRAEVRVSAIK